MSASASSPAPRGAVSLAPLELLHAEFVAYLARSHEAGRCGSEELAAKLEAAGFAVGRRYAERLALALGKKPPGEVLDVVKFVCRELWQEVHLKTVDKLQTNNRGVFVLQDFNYRWLRFVSARAAAPPPPPGAGADAGAGAAAAPGAPAPGGGAGGAPPPPAALLYLLFPCGLVRGALAACGVDAAVNADVSASPRAIFHIRVAGAAE